VAPPGASSLGDLAWLLPAARCSLQWSAAAEGRDHFNACWAITSDMHLVAEVWPATFVEEGSITRNIPI
jgi:hypothetical protein